MKTSQLSVLLIAGTAVALTLAVIGAGYGNKPEPTDTLTSGAVLQATTSSSSSSTAVYGQNKLVLSLNSATGAERKKGEKFLVGLQPQLLESTAVASIDLFVSFNPTLIRATQVIELTTFAESNKALDNSNGIITFDGIAAQGARFTNGQILIQIEFEVLTDDNVITPLAIVENSTLGEPNTVALDGFGKLSVSLNNPLTVTSNASSVSSSISSSSSSQQFVSDVVTPGSTTDWRTVITSGLIALAVSAGVGATIVWLRHKRVSV